MKKKAASLVSVAVCMATLLLSGNAKATLSAVGPFTGNVSETWESFPNYYDGDPAHLPSTTTIMGGTATISNPLMAIYEPGIAYFALAANGYAQVSDGAKGMGADGLRQTVTISFASPVSQFGAYWGASSPTVSSPATVFISFGDGSTTSFSYSRPNDGLLEWHGWSSTVAVTSISYTGDYVAIDGLQTGPTAVPEPSTLIAGLLLVLPFGMFWIRRLGRHAFSR